ncbi:MAG: T9SS type A sorting domain-containing protein [Bacteroidia bacterium]|nr:T9SS type A sorting domain-containing protein [Bacteroidia bacterium]
MKKVIYIFLFVFLFVFSNAQKYQPIDSTITWSTQEVGKNMASCYIKTECKYYLKGYELNNSRIWNKVYRSYFSYGVSWPQCTTYTAPPPVYNVQYGFMNNDSINKKVYFVYNLPPNFTPAPNNLVYDFNKVVGDSMYVNPGLSPFKFVINSIDSILFSGKYHKRFLTSSTPSIFYLANTQVTFVEGVGSSLGALTLTVNPMGEATSNLVCFASPTQTMSISNHSVYANSSACNNITLGISNNHLSEGGIFPNPASNHFMIENNGSNQEEITYEVYNSLGQIQLSGIATGQTKINTETLCSGIYFVKLSNHSQSDIKKLVIQKE